MSFAFILMSSLLAGGASALASSDLPLAPMPTISLEASVRSTSILRRTPSGERQLVMVEITASDSVGGLTAHLAFPGSPIPVSSVLGGASKGRSQHFLEVPLVQQPDSATLTLIMNGQRMLSARGALVPPRRWKVYDVQVSHHDLGYADYYHLMRRDVREMGIEMALEFCRRTDSWPVNDRFRWTVATREPMTKFISSHSPTVLRELAARITEGRIALGGLHNSVYTEMMGYESMARLFYTPNRYITDLLGVPPSKTALITDVVGFARTLPSYLKEADIPFFYHGYNETVNGMYPASREPVFFWKGADGDTGRMPLFRSFPYYSPDRLTRYSAAEIAGLLRKYEQDRPWPYDCLIAEDSYDFSLPQFENVEGIRRWNAQYANPVLVSGTFDMFFEDINGQADRTTIRVFDQDAPDAWADQDGTDAKLMGDARLLNYALPTVEKLSTIAFASGGKGYPWKELWQAYHTLTAYHEHTNGAFTEEDVLPIPLLKDPKAAGANYYEVEQVMHKALVGDAWQRTREARTQAVGQLSHLISTSHDRTVTVFNPLTTVRSGVATLPPEAGKGWQVVDNATGTETVAQEMPSGEVIFAVADVPPMGYRTYRLVRATDARKGPDVSRGQPDLAHDTGIIENRYYRVQIDDSTGAIASILDKTRNIELVDRSSEYRFNQYLYQRIDAPFSRTPNTYRPRMTSWSSFHGPLASGIITEIAAEGCRSIRQTVMLTSDADRIDLIVDLDKSPSGRTLRQPTAQNKEALFYVLPLNVPDFTIHHELPGGVVEPLAHQFEGSTSNYFGIQHFTDLSNSRYGVTLSTVNAPLVQYGTPRPALWLAPTDAEFDPRKPARSLVALYLMNNMFFTNIPVSQPGKASFRWSIRAHDGDWVAGKAYRFAWESSHPFETFLVEGRHQGPLPPAVHSFVTVDRENVVCSTLKPAEANGTGFILRFFELSGKASTVKVTLPLFASLANAVETNLVEVDRDAQLPITGRSEFTFAIAPFGIKTVRVTPGGTAPARVPLAPQAIAPPARAPSHLRAVALSDREVQLTWTAARQRTEAVSYYRVHRGTTEEFVPSLATCVGTATGTSYLDRPLLNSGGWLDNRVEPATTYYYRIEAVGSSNLAGVLTPPVRVTTLDSGTRNTLPNKVLGLAATSVSPISSFHYICLLFSTNVESDVTRYRIFRGDRQGFTPDRAHLLAEIDGRQKFTHVTPHAFATATRELRDYATIVYPDESARPNRRYYYRVSAVDAAGQVGEPSDEVEAISPITRLSFAGDLFFYDSARVDIRPVPDDGSRIHYTLDGSEPTAGSRLYTAPFALKGPATVKAALFAPGAAAASVSGEARFMRSLFAPPRYLQPYSEKWPGQGPLNMVDGMHGAAHFDTYFQGFEGNDMDIVIDLGGRRTIGEVRVTCLQNIGVWIFFPVHVEFFVSHDGANFERVGDVQTGAERQRAEGTLLKEYTVTMEKRPANFVRVKATNIGLCPPWHPGYEYHGKAWVFADEVTIR